ncbi:aminoacyl-tRNA hydrolase [Candidatus Dependentiae bacterium]|nr:aminoacyl-tRNA hydrolase [Candidatus Dependentiae bacterium]
MKHEVVINGSLIIPEHELEITTSRAGGPGGQHVNKTDSRVTVRWNVFTSQVLDETQRARIIKNMQSQLTTAGDLLVHNSESRSQLDNKEAALASLAALVKKALLVPKRRKPTKASQAAKVARVNEKKYRGQIKKMRTKKSMYE